MTTPTEAAKRLQAYLDRGQCRLSIDADLKSVVNHILAKPAVFKVGDRVRAKCLVFPTGMATQLIDKGTECTVAAIPSARHLIFTLGGYRYPADCFELVTEPEPFRIDRVGRYEQRDGGVARVESFDESNYPARGIQGDGHYGSWKLSGRLVGIKEDHQFDLIRYIGPLDEHEPERPFAGVVAALREMGLASEPEPVPVESVDRGGSPESGDPQHDGSMWRDSFCRTERDRKAWHLVSIGIPPDEAFARVDRYLALASKITEAARREKEPT